jgi:hypothetical protein
MVGETRRRIEDILANDPHVKIMPTQERVLEEINYEFISPEQREDVKAKTLPILKEFLETSYFADDFTDHCQRTIYLKKLEQIHGAELFRCYKLSNGLGFTRLTHAVMILDKLISQDYTGPHKKELAEIMKGVQGLTDYNTTRSIYQRYQTLPNEEKIKLVENIKTVIAQALKTLARKQ